MLVGAGHEESVELAPPEFVSQCSEAGGTGSWGVLAPTGRDLTPQSPELSPAGLVSGRGDEPDPVIRMFSRRGRHDPRQNLPNLRDISGVP